MESSDTLAKSGTTGRQDSRSRDQFVGLHVGKRRSHTCVGLINDRKIDFPRRALQNIVTKRPKVVVKT